MTCRCLYSGEEPLAGLRGRALWRLHHRPLGLKESDLVTASLSSTKELIVRMDSEGPFKAFHDRHWISVTKDWTKRCVRQADHILVAANFNGQGRGDVPQSLPLNTRESKFCLSYVPKTKGVSTTGGEIFQMLKQMENRCAQSFPPVFLLWETVSVSGPCQSLCWSVVERPRTPNERYVQDAAPLLALKIAGSFDRASWKRDRSISASQTNLSKIQGILMRFGG